MRGGDDGVHRIIAEPDGKTAAAFDEVVSNVLIEFGNTSGTRRKRYSATAVSQNDRIAISGAFANDAGGQILVSENASENPNQHISDALKSGDVGKLRD